MTVEPMPPKPEVAHFLFIPHTHWEGAVFKTREEYLEMGLPIILRALRLLKQYPDYRFVLDQSCYVQPFLERYPEEAATFRALLAEKRLAIVGGMVVMPDVNMPCGESFVRQMLYGKLFFRRELGADVTVGWLLDTFGHHAQIPQLMRLASYTSFWSQRGIPDETTPSEFVWEGLDGTSIPFYWTPLSYAVTYGSPKTLPEFRRFMIEKYEQLGRFTRAPDRAGPAGADVCLPEEHVPELIEAFNRQPNAPFRLRIGLPSDYEALVEARPTPRPVCRGDLNPIFQGTYSSRIELKQRTREIERLLTAAEKLGAMLDARGLPVDERNLRRAWEPALFNQTHDLMSGVMTDHVYEDTIRLYDVSRQLAEEELETRLQRLASQADTTGAGVPLVVFNPLSWTRTDVVFANAGFTEAEVRGLKLTDPDGRDVPFQIVEADRSGNGSLIRVKIAFLAREVPALGHAVYHLAPLKESAGTEPIANVDAANNVLENEFYRLEVDRATGAIASWLAKEGAWPVLRAPGNVVAMEEDRGDFWELYKPLSWGFITAKDRQGAASPGQGVLSTDQSAAELGTLRRGPVFSELTVAHSFGENGRFETAVRLYAGLRRVEIRTKILNNSRFVRYRVQFPTTLTAGRIVREIPFGAIEQPEGIEHPAQNWLDYGDGTLGVALLNRGLPGNNVAEGVLLLSLLRSTEIVAYGHGGGYEGQASSSGFALGKEFTFDYALVPHAGCWRQAGIYQDGLEFNHPLLARTAAAHPGPLPQRWSFLSVTPDHVVVSALKRGENGGIVLRVYEATGQPVQGGTIRLPAGVTHAEEVNLLEDPIKELKVDNGVLRLDLRPFEIKTIALPARSDGSMAKQEGA